MELALVPTEKKEISLVRTFGDNSDVSFFQEGKNFYVKEKEKSEITKIHSYNVDSLLQKMNNDQLEKFQQTAGYLVAKCLSNGEYKLDAHVKGVGGGYILGECAYWGTKIIGWGTVTIATLTLDPELPLHAVEINMAIETAAQGARYLGYVSGPT